MRNGTSSNLSRGHFKPLPLQSLCLEKLSKYKEPLEVQPVFIHPVHDPLKDIVHTHSHNLNTERNGKSEGKHVSDGFHNAQGASLKLAVHPAPPFLPAWPHEATGQIR